ncbi:MAG: hypothetical protein CMM88_03010 [Rickettsiales bacterium]|jgi:3-oxoacyl-[acyl-carrier protein] reductase|nr:hypothetical protein [Rickettsiales bacterium]MCH2676870.1 SDR family oxidoreductase [Alphaproteobacteria bacterium]HAE75470.1 hypothetical protein [Alphaproteobacteria bacterium]|tara:strand:+ start:249 stop:980 length:732 start_codon:yes stop_codon:yes gene_type:complete
MQAPILILGASGKIGGAIAKSIAKTNTVILQGNRNKSSLKILCKKIGNKCLGVFNADLSNEIEAKRIFEEIENKYKKLSGIIFSIATPFPHKLSFRTKWNIFNEQIETQIKAFHLSVTSAIPLLEKNKKARILVVSTEYVLGEPPTKIAPYVVAKSALTSYAKILSQELISKGIKVHIMAPGLIQSKLTKGLPKKYLEILREEMPEKKLTSLQDISDVATLLMSNKGDVLYGNIIPVTRSKRK